MASKNKVVALIISETTLRSARAIIQSEPNRALSQEDLIDYQHGSISRENARQSLSTLKEMRILNEKHFPTGLGREWANPHTCVEATKSIAANLFPEGACDAVQNMTNKEFGCWFMERKPATDKIAEKNASALRNLLRICQEKPAQEAKGRSRDNASGHGNHSITQQAVVKVSAKAGKSVLREVFELAKETGITVIVE